MEMYDILTNQKAYVLVPLAPHVGEDSAALKSI